jgi:hypothetical protein
MNTINVDDLTYEYHPYEKGVLGKCTEFPALTAQGKDKDEVCGILHEMVKDYFEVSRRVKGKNL